MTLDAARLEFHSFLATEFPRLGQQFPSPAFRAKLLEIMQSMPHIAHNYTALRREGLRQCAIAAGYDPEDVIEPAMSVFIEARNRVTLFEGVPEVLNSLKASEVVLGSVTNGSSDIRKMPALCSVLSFGLRAEDCGAAKPDPRPFLRGIEATGFSASEILYVGDNYEGDVIGAHNVGMPAVWVNRGGAPPPHGGAHAVAIVDCVSNLLPVVLSWI